MLNTSNNRLTITALRFLKRVCNCNLVWQSLSRYSGGKSVTVDNTSRIFFPNTDWFGFSECRQKCIVPSVSGLLPVVSKFTIVWAVTLVVVFSLQLQAGFVVMIQSPSLEIGKRQPTIANGDASSAVPGVVFGSFAETTVFHSFPDFVQGTIGIPFHREIALTGTERLCGSCSTFQATTGLNEFVHTSPPCDIRLGFGEADIGVVSVQIRERTGSYPQTKYLTEGGSNS